eukprot:2657700-Rhodomonas_salina.1
METRYPATASVHALRVDISMDERQPPGFFLSLNLACNWMACHFADKAARKGHKDKTDGKRLQEEWRENVADKSGLLLQHADPSALLGSTTTSWTMLRQLLFPRPSRASSTWRSCIWYAEMQREEGRRGRGREVYGRAGVGGAALTAVCLAVQQQVWSRGCSQDFHCSCVPLPAPG